jgi:hypothetical protein
VSNRFGRGAGVDESPGGEWSAVQVWDVLRRESRIQQQGGCRAKMNGLGTTGSSPFGVRASRGDSFFPAG